MFYCLNDKTLINLNQVISLTKRDYTTGSQKYGIEFLMINGNKYEKYFVDSVERDGYFDLLKYRLP